MGWLNGQSDPVTRGEESNALFPKAEQKAAQKRVEEKRKARLFVQAAPEITDALEIAEFQLSHMVNVMGHKAALPALEQVREAIRKAKGLPF